MESRKEKIMTAIAAFIDQRPGLQFANYGDISSYRSEARSIARDKREADTLFRAVLLRESVTADDLLAAAKHAFSGRLSIEERENGDVEIDYCTGQYFPTEYRKAACAVLASALWAHFRDRCMPEPAYKHYGSATDHPMQTVALYNGKTAGDYIRSTFRKEFGRSMQSRWFD